MINDSTNSREEHINEIDELRRRIADLEQERDGLKKNLSKIKAQRDQEKSQLIQEHNLLSALIDHLPYCIYVKDQDGRFIITNDEAWRDKGLAGKDELLGKSDRDFYPPELAEQYMADEQALLASGKALINHEEPSVDISTGKESYFLSSKIPFRNAQGDIVGLVGIGADITHLKSTQLELRAAHDQKTQQIAEHIAALTDTTEKFQQEVDLRRQIEKRLQHERNLLRTLIDSIPDHIYVKDIRGCFVTANTAVAQLFNFQRAEDMIGKSDFDIHPQEFAEQYYLDEQKVLRDGQSLINYEQSMVDSSTGELLWMQSTKVPLRDADGNIIGLVGINRDITEQHRLEETLHFQASLLDQVSEAVIAVDENFRITSWNKGAERIYGWSAEEALNQHSPTLLQTQYNDDTTPNSALKQFQDTGQWQGEVLHQRKDGKRIPISTTTVTLRNRQHQVIGAVSVVQDITDRKRVEQAQFALVRDRAAIEERQRLARDLHDAVSQTLFSANLIAEALPRLWERNPDATLEQLVRLSRLTKGAMAEMRTLLLEIRPNAFAEVKLGQLLTQLKDAVEGRSDLAVTLQSAGDVMVSEDVKIAFYRIAQEALNNIVKHAKAKTVLIDLNATSSDVTLKVVDDGIGIDPNRPKTGRLGLSIMQERADDIGATFTVENKINEGTQVLVTWSVPAT